VEWRALELLDECKRRGITVTARSKKQDLIDLLRRLDFAEDREVRLEIPPPLTTQSVERDVCEAVMALQRVAAEQERALCEVSASAHIDLGSERGNHEYAALMKIALVGMQKSMEDATPWLEAAGEAIKDRTLEVAIGHQEGWTVVSHLSRKRAGPGGAPS